MIRQLGVVDSTQRVAREWAAEGAPHGSAVRADWQSAGRGRLGRIWVGEPGKNLLLSVILRPGGEAREAPLLSLGAAAGLAVTFGLRVKWPNDLVSADGRKVGGILAELETDGAAVRHVILGLGLNVNQGEFPKEIHAASLAGLAAAGEIDASPWAVAGGLALNGVAEDAVRAILAWSSHPGRLDLWRSRSNTLGRRVRVGDREGVATGLREDGALMLDGEAMLAGDVEMVALQK